MCAICVERTIGSEIMLDALDGTPRCVGHVESRFGLFGDIVSVSAIDEDITPSHTHNDPLLDIQGPITRARARQLNLEVSSFLSNSLYDSENRLLPNDYIVLRYEGEVQELVPNDYIAT
jgi:hypothetical protein